MAQDAPSPGAALFQKLFVRTHEAATEEAQLPALFELFAATHRSTGSNYLNALAVHLTELLNVDLCLITRAEVVDLKQVQAVAHARQGKSEPLVGYSPAGTPCEIVLQGAEYHVADNLIETFPAYKLLEERGYRSYFGVPLWGENEEVIGQICLLDDKPMIDPSFARDIVCMFAPRAAAELLRIQSRKEVDAANESLQRFFSDFPGWVYGYTWSAKGEDREIVFSNGRAADLIGPNNYEMLHRDAALFDALIHPKDGVRVKSIYREARRTLSSYDLEYRVRHDDGSYRWVQATGCFRSRGGQKIYSHSVMLDRDAFRRLERRHEELSQELQTLIRTIPDAVIASTLRHSRAGRFVRTLGPRSRCAILASLNSSRNARPSPDAVASV